MKASLLIEKKHPVFVPTSYLRCAEFEPDHPVSMYEPPGCDHSTFSALLPQFTIVALMDIGGSVKMKNIYLADIPRAE